METFKVNYKNVKFVREENKEGVAYNACVIAFDDDFSIKFFLDNNELLLLKKKFDLNTQKVGEKILNIANLTFVKDVGAKSKKEFSYLDLEFPFRYTKRLFIQPAEVVLVEEFYIKKENIPNAK